MNCFMPDRWSILERVSSFDTLIEQESMILAVTDYGEHYGFFLRVDEHKCVNIYDPDIDQAVSMPSDAYIYREVPSLEFQQMINIIAICM